MPQLPEVFVSRMNLLFQQLGKAHEFDAFLDSFNDPPVKGIRINGNKVNPAEVKTVLDELLLSDVFGANNDNNGDGFKLTKVPWSDDGWFIPKDSHPGRHPYYSAGLFYIQEPSAMLPAFLANAGPGERVLDLCAAPGGKTVKL